jgi:hypothetical protein
MTIAQTIMQQIGGRAFFMIGASNFVAQADGGLSFKVGKNAKGVTHLNIELDPSDTYSVRALRVTKRSIAQKGSQCFVYADQLHTAIEALTGLYTSL